MANEAPIVEIVKFVPTKRCLTDPSLFPAVRDIVERWREKGMKGQYWGMTVDKTNNLYWVLFWQSRAHAAAFATDPMYPEFIQRRESLATSPVCDLHVAFSPLSGTPQICVEAPLTVLIIYHVQESHVEKGHEASLMAFHRLPSLQVPGFKGNSTGVADEDPAVGVYISGWNSLEEHLRVGMEEGQGHEKFKEESEEAMRYFSDLILVQIVFKKHSA